MASDRTKEEILHEKILSTKITYQDGMSKITATIDKGSRKKASNESKNKLQNQQTMTFDEIVDE